MAEIIAGFFITFILCMGELGTTLLVIPPGQSTIPITIYNYMHYGVEEMTAALCLILVGIMSALSFLLFYIYRRYRIVEIKGNR